MTTIFSKVREKGEPFNSGGDWQEWRNVKPSDVRTMPQLILHKWLRERGGIAWGESLSVTVYTHDETVERHANGSPRACIATTFEVTRDAEGIPL